MSTTRFALAMRIGGAAALVGVSVSASAGVIKAEFDDGTSGWSAQTGTVDWSDTGGVPGGYLMIESEGGAFGVAAAPAQFTGNLASYNAGAFTFDASVVARGFEVPSVPPIGSVPDLYSVTVTIVGANGLVATASTAPVTPSARWISMGFDFTADAFGVSESDWLSILADVDALTVTAQGQGFLLPFTLGLDNIALVPAPGAAVAMLGLAAFSSRRRRD